jgi:hypothetical protein
MSRSIPRFNDIGWCCNHLCGNYELSPLPLQVLFGQERDIHVWFQFLRPPRQFAAVLENAICRTSICMFVGMPPGPGAAEIRPAME